MTAKAKKREYPRQITNIVRKIVYGIITGITYYIIYVVLLPNLLKELGQLPIKAPPDIVFYMGFFIALGTAESILGKHPVSIPLRVLSKLFGALVLFKVMNGGEFSADILHDGITLHVEMGITPILYTIMMFSLIYGFLDAFDTVTRSELAE